MRNNKAELDVDFIGSQTPLTKEEQKAISDFIKSDKLKHPKTQTRTIKTRSIKQKAKQ